jgi:hypothetical protein
VPFLRFSRDKRGYENIYLVHAQNKRGKPSRPRVLYWYRTPPGIKVGRPPFDDEARRRLEAQNPDVTFDWAAIIATPMPPPAENEQWRERRRAERAAKYARRAEEAVEPNEHATAAEQRPRAIEPDELVSAVDEPVDSLRSPGNEPETVGLDDPHETAPSVDFPTETVGESSQTRASQVSIDRPHDPAARKRRRRGGRRRRGRRQPDLQGNQPAPEGENPGAATTREHGSGEAFSDSTAKESIESTDE